MTDATEELSVREIVHRGGGPKGLSDKSLALRKAGEAEFVAEKTIYSWFKSGIPEKHWRFVMPACGVTEEQLHRANEDIRRKVGGRGRKSSEMAAA